MRAQRVVDRDALVVDFLGVADHPRHGSQAARHPHRAGIGEGGQAALEHARIELIGLAVHVHEAAREMRAHQRIAVLHHAGDQVVDEAVLRPAQGGDIEPRDRQEGARIGRAAVRGIEQHRPLAGRPARGSRTAGRVRRGFHSWRPGPWSAGYHCDGPVFRARLYRLLSMRRGTKAKPCFRFTRYLPGISLMGRLGPAFGAGR